MRFFSWIKKPVNKLIFIRSCLLVFNMLLVLGSIVYVILKLKGKI